MLRKKIFENKGYYRMKHADVRITTIPVHKNDPVPKGLLRKILREDIEITPEELDYLLLFRAFKQSLHILLLIEQDNILLSILLHISLFLKTDTQI